MAMKSHYISYSFQRAANIRVPLAPTIKFEINPENFQMLPNFHGLSLEEPHQHLEKFHMVCDLVNFPQVTLEIIKMKLFPHTLRDKVSHWLSTFDRELTRKTFHETWETCKDLLRKCPHHAIPKWQLNRIFYDGLLEQDRNMVDSICGGAFMEKTPDEIYSLYENLSENSRDQASFELYDKKLDLLIENSRQPLNPQFNLNSTCPMYGENDHSEFQYHPKQEQVQVSHDFSKNREYFSNSYNPNWGNNFSWRNQNNIQNPNAL
ncbi:unnamed protein product [Spirodela intermedia]|uniref:Retrotransposon gag domain-containing protein n=1 Tax=Spirodela intermedia TaxID=51605 RepID=A0ABN7E8M3_SPIIN|nr:unnamed protein product [Spirodela intermedia]